MLSNDIKDNHATYIQQSRAQRNQEDENWAEECDDDETWIYEHKFYKQWRDNETI